MDGEPKIDSKPTSDSIRLGIHINPAWLGLMLLCGAFNAGIMWSALSDFTKRFDALEMRLNQMGEQMARAQIVGSTQSASLTRIERAVDDHETRIRVVEKRK